MRKLLPSRLKIYVYHDVGLNVLIDKKGQFNHLKNYGRLKFNTGLSYRSTQMNNFPFFSQCVAMALCNRMGGSAINMLLLIKQFK